MFVTLKKEMTSIIDEIADAFWSHGLGVHLIPGTDQRDYSDGNDVVLDDMSLLYDYVGIDYYLYRRTLQELWAQISKSAPALQKKQLTQLFTASEAAIGLSLEEHLAALKAVTCP